MAAFYYQLIVSELCLRVCVFIVLMNRQGFSVALLVDPIHHHITYRHLHHHCINRLLLHLSKSWGRISRYNYKAILMQQFSNRVSRST